MIEDATELLIEAGAIPRVSRIAVASPRQKVCEACERYGRLSEILMPFEISEADRRSDDRVCTHPNCGCWRGLRRAQPWFKLRKCPDGTW